MREKKRDISEKVKFFFDGHINFFQKVGFFLKNRKNLNVRYTSLRYIGYIDPKKDCEKFV